MEMRWHIKDLKLGGIYRDTLSGQLVLVTKLNVKQPNAEGLWWNPVAGQHQTMKIHDLQLENAAYPPKYYPRNPNQPCEPR